MRKFVVVVIIISFTIMISDCVNDPRIFYGSNQTSGDTIKCKYGYHLYKQEPKVIRNGYGKCQESETELFLQDLPAVKMNRSVCCLPPSPRRYFQFSQKVSRNHLKKRLMKREVSKGWQPKNVQGPSDDLAYMAIGAFSAQLIMVFLSAILYKQSNGRITIEIPKDCNHKVKPSAIDKADLHSS